MTFYVSFRSAFSGTSGKSAGLKSNGSGRKNEKGSDDDDDKTSARSALLDHDNCKGASDSAASAASKSSRGDEEANAADKYFLAGRGANNIIVAISLLSGLTSGVSFLGVPAYGYENGIGVLFPIFVGQVIAGYVIAQLIIPFYSNLRLSTPYTYLERRFNRSVRTVAACLFCFRIVAYMTVVIQAPAILFKATAGVDGWITALVCGLFATIFTMKGGMKSVIITDFMQSLALSVGQY